jgi:ribosomal protein S18 acetylase RimI-like enzyme
MYMIEIKTLGEDRWQDYRDLRLESLKKEPLAYESSYEEAIGASEDHWRNRMKDVLFALNQEKPVGIIVCVRETMVKCKHIANIWGVYVTQEYRGQGVGKQLMEAALARIKESDGIVKVKLTANPTQKPAVKLYQNFGFKIAGHVKKELYIDGKFYDELIMEKML